MEDADPVSLVVPDSPGPQKGRPSAKERFRSRAAAKRPQSQPEQNKVAGHSDKYRLALAGITTSQVLLTLGACWVFYSVWSSATSMFPAGLLGITTLLQGALLLGFVSFAVGHAFLLQGSGATGYSIVSATILIYFAKCVVSSFMFCFRTDVQVGVSCLLAPGCTRFGKVPAWALPIIPGALLALSDALTFLSLNDLDPVTYQILLSSRTVFAAIFWQFMFKRWLSKTQWLALFLFIIAGVTKGIDGASVKETNIQSGVLVMLTRTFLGALANVMSEVLLKEMDMPTDLNNACTYFWGLVGLVIALLCGQGPNALYDDLLSASAWESLSGDPRMIGGIVCFTVWGIVCAYLLKELSNIVKELAQAFVIVISVVLEWRFSATPMITSMGMRSVGMAVLGICVFSTDPLQKKREELQEDTAADSRILDKSSLVAEDTDADGQKTPPRV